RRVANCTGPDDAGTVPDANFVEDDGKRGGGGTLSGVDPDRSVVASRSSSPLPTSSPAFQAASAMDPPESPSMLPLPIAQLAVAAFPPRRHIPRDSDGNAVPYRHTAAIAAGTADSYFVLTGAVNILVNGKMVVTFREGSFFGEVALIANIPRTASVQAATSCILYCLTQQDFHAILSEFEDMRFRIDRIYQERMEKVRQEEEARKLQKLEREQLAGEEDEDDDDDGGDDDDEDEDDYDDYDDDGLGDGSYEGGHPDGTEAIDNVADLYSSDRSRELRISQLSFDKDVRAYELDDDDPDAVGLFFNGSGAAARRRQLSVSRASASAGNNAVRSMSATSSGRAAPTPRSYRSLPRQPASNSMPRQNSSPCQPGSSANLMTQQPQQPLSPLNPSLPRKSAATNNPRSAATTTEDEAAALSSSGHSTLQRRVDQMPTHHE
ncbi:Potassium voltage-gated channel sub H member 7, partial [Cladochytrium tenue]